MSGLIAKAALSAAALSAVAVAVVLIAPTNADARPKRAHPAERPPAAVPTDKRDSVVAAPGAYNGRPYWLVLAQCGGIYFKLNNLYTEAAVRARVIKPDARANAEYTKKLTEAIKIATAYFDGAERFLMTDRGIERNDAALTYDGQSRTAGDRFKTIDAALNAAQACPALYQACQEAFPKACSEPLAPMG